jgi:hypothetical protein
VRALALALAVTALAVVGVTDAHAEGGALWRSAPALAPPPPTGTAPAPYAVPVGEVGEISFWSANQGLLITGGTEVGRLAGAPENGPVPAGLYAYDGASWHQLANVCGGREGRIAWAGADEFWTISDQRAGQVLASGDEPSLESISLCHFLDGQVVGSYAMPLEEPGSYLHMNAAACYGPSDCWFGGEDGQSPNVGAFHLHWDGSSVTAVYEPEDHVVTGMVNFAGQIYESVQIGEGDAWLPSENQEHPAVIHTIAPAGLEPTFEDLVIFPFLPEYGTGVAPDALGGFDLGSNGSPLGAGATQLWAAANQHGAGALTVLHYDKTTRVWSQVLGAERPSPLRRAAVELAGAATQSGTSGAIAPEPGSEASAWLSLKDGGAGTGAEVALLRDDGTVEQEALLPEAGEAIGFRGTAGPIACAAPHDCWMATNSGLDPARGQQVPGGWLFHLTDGSTVTQSTDPLFDGADGVITYRPPDSGVPIVYPDLPPVDDSLANQQPPPAPTGPAEQTPAGGAKPTKPLVQHIKSHFVQGHVLVVSFTLTARAHVQLIGRRKRKVVASTRKESLRPGRHRLSLSLNPAHWPTKLQFKATPVGASTPAPGGSPAGGGADTVGT